MGRSNIIGESNVYPCKGNPLTDQEFVKHVKDYEHIKTIHKMQESRRTFVHLTEKQSQLLEIEMRCVFLRDRPDPCWGYIEGQGIRSRCIEGKCPRILKCNPTYTKEQAEYWTMTEDARVQYGRPDKQKKYYLVDLVSDQEMFKYISDSKGVGLEHPMIKDSEPENMKKEKNGRRKVVIGFEEIYFGDADNQLSPIWGYVDDIEDVGTIVTHRYGSRKESIYIKAQKENKLGEKEEKKVGESIKDVKTISKKEVRAIAVKRELNTEVKQAYEQRLKDKISGSYPLTDITEELIQEISGGKDIAVILANEAELAYVSGMFLQAGIMHDVGTDSGKERVVLWKPDSRVINIGDKLIVSSEFVKQGCNLSTKKTWEEIQTVQLVKEISVTGREFFSFSTAKGERWGCRNLYGATHLVVKAEDFELFERVTEEQEIILMKDVKNYIILSKSSAEQLGVANETLWMTLESLKRQDEILGFPKIISGLVISNIQNSVQIKGIGHMKFDEY